MGTTQASLLDCLADGPPPLTGTEHLDLGAGAWLEVCRGWLPDWDLFDVLAGGAPWRTEQRPMYDRVVDVPRLLAFYDDLDLPLPHPALVAARVVLDEHYWPVIGEPFRTLGLCCYRDGADSVAWHGDTVGRGARQDTVVAILSLGATRRFGLRPVGGGPGLRLDVRHGDLVVMGGSCQRTWQHCVPKTARPVGARISAQFRARDVR